MNRSLFLAALVGLVACAGKQVPTTQVHSVRAERVEVDEQDFTSFTPAVVLGLGNAAPVKIVEARFEVLSRESKLGNATLPLDLTVAPGEIVTIKGSPTPYAESEEKLADVLEIEGALPLVVKGELRTASGDVYEFSRAGQVRTPRIPNVRVWHIEVSTYPDEDRISVLLFVRVVNKNPFDIQLEEITYDLAIGGRKLITQGIAGTKEVIGAATGGQIEIPVDVTKNNFPDVKRYLRKWGELPYRLDGEVRLGVGRMPVSLAGALGDEEDRFEESESVDTSDVGEEE